MMNNHDETVTRQDEKIMDNDWDDADGSASLASVFDYCPVDSEDDTLNDDCEWRIPQQYHPPAKQHLTINTNRISKSDHRLSIKSQKLKIARDCHILSSPVSVPPELVSPSLLPISSNLSSDSSSVALLSSSAHQSIIANASTATTIMIRRPSTRSHRYLDDDSSLGPDGSDIFTICGNTSTTFHPCMEEWSHHNRKTSKNQNSNKLWQDLDSGSVHRVDACSQSWIDDVSNSFYSDERDWSPMEDMTVWSLDWTDEATSIHSLATSPAIHENDSRYLLQDSPTTSPLCRWDMLYGTSTGQEIQVDSSTTGVSGGDEDEDKSPLLLARQVSWLIDSTSISTESRLSPSTDTRRHSIKSAWRRKREKRFGYQKIHREASKQAMLLQLPELNSHPTTKKALSHQLSWSEKTALTDYSTSSDSAHSHVVQVVPRFHVSWDEDSFACHKTDIDQATSTVMLSPRMNQICNLDCGAIGWDRCPPGSTSVGMWSQCDEDAIDSGSDWILVVGTGWSDMDEVEMYHVHRTVLVETCALFRHELLDNNAKEKGYSIVELDKSLQLAIPDMLDFIYRYKYSHMPPFRGNSLDPTCMDPATAFSLRRLGDYFGVVGLKEAMDQLFD